MNEKRIDSSIDRKLKTAASHCVWDFHAEFDWRMKAKFIARYKENIS